MRWGCTRRYVAGPGRARRHVDLLHHRRQRRLGRRHTEPVPSTKCVLLNGAPGIETTEFLLSKVDVFRHPEGLQPLCGGLAARKCAHRISGPSRWPHIGAAPVTAPSCTGPTVSPIQAKTRNQFHHVIDIAKTILEAAGVPEPIAVNGIQQAPLEGVSMLSTLRDGNATENTHGAVLRDVRQPRHLPQWVDGGDQTQHPLEARPRRRPSMTTHGSCMAQTTGPRPTTWRRRILRSSPTCSGCGSSKPSSTTWCR